MNQQYVGGQTASDKAIKEIMQVMSHVKNSYRSIHTIILFD